MTWRSRMAPERWQQIVDDGGAWVLYALEDASFRAVCAAIGTQVNVEVWGASKTVVDRVVRAYVLGVVVTRPRNEKGVRKCVVLLSEAHAGSGTFTTFMKPLETAVPVRVWASQERREVVE